MSFLIAGETSSPPAPVAARHAAPGAWNTMQDWQAGEEGGEAWPVVFKPSMISQSLLREERHIVEYKSLSCWLDKPLCLSLRMHRLKLSQRRISTVDLVPLPG